MNKPLRHQYHHLLLQSLEILEKRCLNNPLHHLLLLHHPLLIPQLK
jgi:hypothetical protein